MTLKLTQLIDQVHAARPTLNRDIAQGFVESFLSSIKASLLEGHSVSLDGLGQLKLRQGAQRYGRNPKTGVKVIIAPKVRCKFQVAKTLMLTRVAP